MLENLQAWVTDYHERNDQWSYHADRLLFDAYTGYKNERIRISRVAT